jgi:hypothetical protein
VDDVANWALGSESAECTMKGGIKVEAVGAGPISLEPTVEGMSAGKATGVENPGKQGQASIGEM